MRPFTLIAMTLLVTNLAASQDRAYGRSMVISPNGIVATSHYLASQAGARILAQGGTAVDAAIAANAVLSVTEPMMNGIGGDMFAIYWDAKTGKISGINASGWAPQALTPDHLRAKGITKMPSHGIDSVTVPGAVAGWAAMHKRFGKLPWRDLFQPAIYYAENGYAVPEIIHDAWANAYFTDEGKRVFLPNGHPPELGAVFKNPDYARALRLLADRGPDVFYRGEIGQALIATSSELGGTMTAEDLAQFAPEWVDPISTDYRGWRVYELPPNGQGMAALSMLNIMEQAPPSADGPQGTAELHKKIEAMQLAYADLQRYLADPRVSTVPTSGLLSKQYAAKRAKLIDPNKARCDYGAGAPTGSDTTYLTTVDREGNIVSWINSNYSEFGSGVVVKGMGFTLQNRGALFALDPAHPNVLAGHKRPYHTIIPAFMEKGDQHIGFGIMGGANQPLAHAQFVSNLVDYGMNVQAAISAPRFTVGRGDFCHIPIESRVKSDVIEALRAKGHNLEVRKEYTSLMGRGQAILHDSSKKMNFAASDPRADGSAEAEPPAFPHP
ncbi:MAG: gamma-glutamyltransferase [Acidobacteria bacterium]|nr:MAG: gamma-glutamyltransferase [Acidobacteriota bacterium]